MKPSRSWCAAAFGLGALLIVAAPGLAAQQALAGPLAAQHAASTSLAYKQPGCWACVIGSGGFGYCEGGHVPGYYNCSYGWLSGTCIPTSPGCGGGALLPLDPDGSTQYVSRAPEAGVFAAVQPGEEAVVRNCDGVVVARRLTEEQITDFRSRTASLDL
ncbi:MAG TPA: hypothetical protein VNJ71_02575 [Gemmatimonadales bacterium]|jgi:hypothetical protein|nr:hypothetical protein [Gemmatimonadales bacterium]